MKYKNIIMFLACLCLPIATNGQLRTNNTSQILIEKEPSLSCVSVKTLESNNDLYKVRVRISRINDETIVRNNQVFHRLSLDDNMSMMEVGKPALPIISQFIGIPVGKSYSAVITEEKWIEVNMGRIYPAQIPHLNSSSDTAFVYSEKDYNVSLFKHELLTGSKVMEWKGIENVILNICPFKYFPQESRLSVLSEFTLTVSFSSNIRIKPQKITAKERDLNVFSNKNFLSQKNISSMKSKERTLNDDYDYLIIVGNIPEIENSQEMKEFRRWKALKGFKTKLVSTSTIGSDSASIKSFIDNEYDTYSIERVLFVGDHTKIPLPVFPARTNPSGDHPILKSDYWYGCRGGFDDEAAEIPIGRFITNTLNDFRNLVNKTIKYESLSHTWSDRILLIANLQYAPYFYQGAMEAVRTENYIHPMSFYKAYAASESLGGNNARCTDIYNYINNGINIVAYNGHGDHASCWLDYAGYQLNGDHMMNQGDTTRMDRDTHSVFVSMACSNGDFTNQYSLIREWTRSDHCASAYIGGTVPVFTYAANDYLMNFHKELLNNDNYLLGHLNLTANILGFNQGNTAYDNAFCFICGGDPSLELWTGVQCTFDSPLLSVSNNNLIISTSISGFSVNLASADGTLLGTYESNGTSITIPLPTSDCDIALNKHNYIPYVIHFGTQYIQNETVSGHAVYTGTPLQIGYNVTNAKAYGNVVIEPSAKVTIFNGNGGVKIQNGFECRQGAEFEIK